MAPRMVTVDGRSEAEYRADINRAIADTEQEIFSAATGAQELDNDGDRSLEEMSDGPGDDLIEDEDEAEVEGEEGEAEEEESPEEAPQQIEQEAAQPEQRRQGIPSGRLREESEARRQAEEEAFALQRELAQMRGRMDELSARVNAPPQPQQPQRQERPPKPDRYTDEAAYDEWMLQEGRRLAREDFELMMAQERQQRQAEITQRVEQSFGYASQGERRMEFLDAYDRLTHLDPRDPGNRALVNSIAGSINPAEALFDWYDNSFPPSVPQPQPRQRAAPSPRHEVRLPPNMGARNPPSLNSMGGGGPGQRVDPELYDDTDAAVFRYAMR